MSVSLDALLQAGVHFGHQTRRWNPKMRRFIFAERNGIHIIDLQKTVRQIELAQQLVREVVARGEQVLYVCTKRQLGSIIRSEAERANAMYVTERWLGGMLTNFATVKKQTKRLKELEAGSGDGGDVRPRPHVRRRRQEGAHRGLRSQQARHPDRRHL